MGYATADGQYHEDELSFLKQSFQDYASGNESSGPLKITVTPPQDASQIDSKPRTEVLQGGELPTPSPESAGDKSGYKLGEKAILPEVAKYAWDQWQATQPYGFVKNTITGLIDSAQKINEGGQKWMQAVQGKRPMSNDELIEFATEAAMALGVGGISTASSRAGVGVFGGLAGGSRTSLKKLETLDKAIELQATKDSKEIWSETGWWKDPRDNHWKFEIPDNKAKIDHELLRGLVENVNKEVNLGDVLGHAPLFKAYPDLKNMKVTYDPNFNSIKGWESTAAAHWQPWAKFPDGQIKVGPNFMSLSDVEQRSILLHEIQHGIQVREGFGKGGNTINNTPQEYRNLAGERESRNVEKREELRRQGKEPGFPPHTDRLDDAQQMRLNEASRMMEEQLERFWPKKKSAILEFLNDAGASPQMSENVNKTIKGYQIIDKHTGQPVSGVYKNEKTQRSRARSRVDKLDNEYGGYRYSLRPIYDE